MKRDLFLDNPRCRWTQTPRVAQSPAEYASPLHRFDKPTGYSKAWWACMVFFGAAALFFTFMT